jgi:selenocysteine lyase/cysteine desulfurase
VSYRAHFSRSLGAAPGRIHLAAHSHHLWPDAAFRGHEESAELAATEADRKWDTIFGSLIPEVSARIAGILGLDPSGDTLAFAPNTHDFLLRILSCFPTSRALTVLTTDGEFHSFERQLSRLEEDGSAHVVRIAAEPRTTFAERFAAAANRQTFDLAFLSQVSFRSGAIVQNLEEILEAIPASTAIVVDGYHAFCAVPTNLQRWKHRIFYVAGGYKYAMSGEGCCFLHAPDGVFPRPKNTGWFAAFGALEDGKSDLVPFAPHGGRFFGATFDPTGLFRLRRSLEWMETVGYTVERARDHAHDLQLHFLKETEAVLPHAALVVSDADQRGQFLTYDLPNARAICNALIAAGVIVDVRDTRIRFGFGAYTDEGDVDAAVNRLVPLIVDLDGSV